MKTFLLILSMSLSITSYTFAQEELEPSKKERLQSLKVAYLTRELSLSPAEAQQFWPLYNEMAEKMKVLRKEKRANRRATKMGFSTMTDDEIERSLEKELDTEQAELDLKRDYSRRFLKVLPVRKVAKLMVAEDGFRRELLKGAQKRKEHYRSPH